MIGPIRTSLRRAWHLPGGGGRVGLALLIALAAGALLGPLWLPDPRAIPDPLAGASPPSLSHWLGTDPLSRDVLARVVSGGRVSLTVAGISVALSISLGAAIGIAAGLAGGWLDTLAMRAVDAAMAVPRLFILLLLVAVWERMPLTALVVVIGATGWFATSRLIRGEVLRLKRDGFVDAARALGAGPLRVAWRHLLPNVSGPLLVAATLGIGEVILLEAGLSFLGVGVQPPTPSWGGMILDARPVLLTAPWTSLAPGICIAVTVLAANLVGDALRSAFDPRSA